VPPEANAAEAKMAGLWKEVPLRGKTGAVAVLREREDLEAGDHPVAGWWHEETARLWSILLPGSSVAERVSQKL
jgi:hypothetical protein